MFRIVVFVSGRGSNLKSVYNSIVNGKIKAHIFAVVSNKKDCGAIDFAKRKNINTYFVSSLNKVGSVSYSELVNIFESNRVNLIVLAGFLKKIPDYFVQRFEFKIINIHPALLPFFGGKGMYGKNVHRAVFNSGTKVSGATVHFVDTIFDHGLIIAQQCTDISNAKTPEAIAEKVLKIEHKILPVVVKKFVERKVKVESNRVFLLE
ncbi:phosphoribosylglycinamide formyltransferase [bacterium BMS3Abin04]|nr:phosphoribosylglycinamide formyltransferase [bacterium BMS3Abin04]